MKSLQAVCKPLKMENRKCLKSGAGCGTRTRDLMITNQLLYQLS